MNARGLALRILMASLAAMAAGRAARAQGGAPPASPSEARRAAAAPGQPLAAILADLLYDPFVPLEAAESGGSLLVHYAVPLLDGSSAYMEFKSGSYIPCLPPGSGMPSPCGADAWASQVWNVRKLVWSRGALTTAWEFASDWKPVPDGGGVGNWQPVFHPALARDFLYVPGSSGAVYKLSKASGNVIARINPFGIPDNPTYVAGGLAADAAGNVYYNAIALNRGEPWGSDALGAWLVRIAPDGTASKAAFSSLVPGAPAPSAACRTSFTTNLPWPPSAAAVPPSNTCGSQRPGINVIPAAAPDGTIYTVSRAHFNGRYAYVVAVHPDLTPAWSASLRNILSDGCDVGLPPSGTPGGCRAGSTRGVDPATNDAPAGRVVDVASSSPVVLPDGVLYCAFTSYNFSRGHLFKFTSDGRAAATYDFGWDITPAVYPHDGTYSILLKDNHYELGTYCNDPTFCPPETPRYDFVSLDANLSVEWKFRNTNTLSCRRESNGEVTCVSNQPNGFEWCINQPGVDGNGVAYVNSEDGFLYAIAPGGTLVGRIFLDLALGAAYTPLAISESGLIYAQNNGHLFVVGNPVRVPAPTARKNKASRSIKPR